MTAEDIIAHFKLQPLPVEGGYFSQTYLSPDVFDAASGRSMGTAILYLLTNNPDSFSALHRLPVDEFWHFYLGDPAEMLQLYPDGRSERVILGSDVLGGQRIQHLAPRDVWQGTRLLPGGQWALMGTTMAPGFIESDYLGGDRDALIAQYPDQADLIRALTRPHESRRRMG